MHVAYLGKYPRQEEWGAGEKGGNPIQGYTIRLAIAVGTWALSC